MLLLLEEFCARGSNITNAASNSHPPGAGANESAAFNVSSHGPQYSGREYREITFSTIWISLQINAIICVVQLLAFWILLRWKPHIMAPRLAVDDVPKWPLGWAHKVWVETKMGRGNSSIHIASRLNNLDGAVMVRYCVLGFKWSACGALLGCFLIPWYQASDSDNVADDFTEYNLANLKEGHDSDGRFWPAIVCAYILVLFFAHLAIDEWCNFDVMRKEHFGRLARGDLEEERPGAAQAQRSVLVEDVPPKYRNVNGESVQSFFAKLFPFGGVHSAVVQAETGELHGKVDAVMMYEGKKSLRLLREAFAPQLKLAQQERMDQAEVLRRNTADLESLVLATKQVSGNSSKGSPTLRRSSTQMSGCSSIEETEPAEEAMPDNNSSNWRPDLREVAEGTGAVAAAAFGHGRNIAEGVLNRVQQAGAFVQDITFAHEGGINVGSSTAFVTFKTVSDRVAAEQLVLVQSDMQALTRQGWSVYIGPEAADIVWANASVAHAQSGFRTAMVEILLFVAKVFWVIPITLIQVWARIDNWNIPWILELQKHRLGRIIYTVLASYLPVLAQMGLMYALPVLLDMVAQRIEGCKVKSKVQIATVSRYLWFLMVTIYCTIVGGSLLQSMCAILEEPWDIFDLLQREVPQVACYFITYVMARAGLSAPMLLVFSLLSAFEAKDKHGRILIRPNFALEASNLVLVFVLGSTYCVIAPMIMFPCAFYFAMTALVYGWLFLYVYTPEYDCHGRMWEHMFRGSMWGLLFGVASLTGIASTYVGPTSGAFAACLVLVFILIFLIPFFRFTYAEPARFVPLEVAREIDIKCSPDKVDQLLHRDYYFDPVITGHSQGLLSNDAGWCFCCRGHRRTQTVNTESDDDEFDAMDSGSAEEGRQCRYSSSSSSSSSDTHDEEAKEATTGGTVGTMITSLRSRATSRGR